MNAADSKVTDVGFPAPQVMSVLAALALAIVARRVQRLEAIDGRKPSPVSTAST